jgi:signal transduction histidine kinase
LTLVYTSLFAVGGGALVAITYLLVAHSLKGTKSTPIPLSVQTKIDACLSSAKAGLVAGGTKRCQALYTSGVKAGAATQRGTTLTHLLVFSLAGLAVLTLISVYIGWIVAGRILRPVNHITAAARAATDQDLSQRIALQGPRDELKELADTFDDMLERLERSFTGQRQFISNASHELRTPLTVMRTTIDVVLAKPKPSRDELAAMAADVRLAVDHAERLIEALLVLARNEQARALTDVVDLSVVAEDALDGRSAEGITTITDLDEALVIGDPTLLERLASNLLDNAMAYNNPGGTVSISTAVDEETCLLRVVNTGARIPAAAVPDLFLPFSRLDDRTRHDGFGLGLTLVASIAAAHGGSVDAIAVPTGGLDITARLPRHRRP